MFWYENPTRNAETPVGNDGLCDVRYVVLDFNQWTFWRFTPAEDGKYIVCYLYKLEDGEEKQVGTTGESSRHKMGDEPAWPCLFRTNGRGVKEPGTYKLFIPKGYLGDEEWGRNWIPDDERYKSGRSNPDLYYYFNVSEKGEASLIDAPRTVCAEEVPADSNVYDITGHAVMRNAADTDLDNLPKGLYIWRGKKIMKN